MAESGHVQDELGLVGNISRIYWRGTQNLSKPDAFDIKPAFSGEGYVRESYGYSGQPAHPTPTAPGKGTI